MSDELSAIEKSVEEVLIDLMDKKLMSAGIKASSTRGAQASPLSAHRYRPSVFHTYYLQLKRAIVVVPCMISNTLHQFRPLMKFRAYQHFIYITMHVDKHKEELQSYYKITEEYLEEITKD